MSGVELKGIKQRRGVSLAGAKGGEEKRRLGQALMGGVGGCFGAVRAVGLVEDVSNVIANCPEADEQFLGNLPVGLAGGDKAQHLNLPLGLTRGI